MRKTLRLLQAAFIGILLAPSLAFAAGNNLTVSGITYDTTTPKFGGGALNGGYGYTTANPLIVSPGAYTLEAWVKTTATPSTAAVAAGQVHWGWIGMDTSGNAKSSIGSVNFNTTTKINDGVYHHLAVSVTATSGMSFYVDGVSVGTNASTVSAAGVTYDQPFVVGAYVNNGQNPWVGNVDEAALFTGARYSANFTPPTAAYSGLESNLIALYHLDSSAVDSAGGSTFVADNASIYYSPYNWLVASGTGKTINGGAYYKTMFSTTSATLNFNVAANNSTYYPEIEAFVDGQLAFSGPIAATVQINAPSAYSGWSRHNLRVIVKGITGNQDRWNTQPAALIFTGITLPSGGTLSLPKVYTKRGLFFGDSITEGEWTIAKPASPTSDATYYNGRLGWAFQVGDALGMEFGIVGFGRQGYGITGVGNVPVVTSSYNLLWAGQARSFSPAPDIIFVNEGTNDTAGNGSSDATVQAGTTTLLNSLLSATPTSAIVTMRPFNGQSWSAIQAGVSAVGSSKVSLMDTTGFFTTTDSADGLHPLGVANIGAIGPAVTEAARPILYPTGVRVYTYY